MSWRKPIGVSSLPVMLAGQLASQRPQRTQTSTSMSCFQVKSWSLPAPKRLRGLEVDDRRQGRAGDRALRRTQVAHEEVGRAQDDVARSCRSQARRSRRSASGGGSTRAPCVRRASSSALMPSLRRAWRQRVADRRPRRPVRVRHHLAARCGRCRGRREGGAVGLESAARPARSRRCASPSSRKPVITIASMSQSSIMSSQRLPRRSVAAA